MPDNVVYKTGHQSPEDPLEFIMSTKTTDRYGDTVIQDWDLRDFENNPIALYGHDHDKPIGNWKNVRVVAGKLRGKLALAKEGTSEFIDTVRSLLDQRILRAVSVGFIPGKAVPLDAENPWDGYELSNNALLECSLCAVGANQDALLVGRSLRKSLHTALIAKTSDPMSASAATQLGITKSRDGGKGLNPQHKPLERKTTMSPRISDQIETLEKDVNGWKNELSAVTELSLDPDNTDDTVDTQMDELSTKIEDAEKSLERLHRAERNLAAKSTPAPRTGSEGPTTDNHHISISKDRKKAHVAFSALACMVKGLHEQRPAELVAKDHFGADDGEISMVIRAASDPATMTDAAWAAPLVRQSWGEYLDLIRDISVYPRAPGVRVEFDSAGKIVLPRNTGRGKLAGSFVGEGAPIPVKEGSFGSTDLQPKRLAVISTFTEDLMRHSIPAIDSIIRQQMLEDTAETLDTLFLDATARGAIRPAGLQDPTETVAANIVASTGNTVANINTDATGVLGRVIAARAGTGGAWIMNPLRVLGLQTKQDAASGAFTFRDQVASGVFMGYPIIMSANVPVGVVAFIGAQAMGYANDFAPLVRVSTEATLHMEDSTPKEIVDATPTTANPVRSLFQTSTVGIKLEQGLDWRILRAGGVQLLTGVSW